MSKDRKEYFKNYNRKYYLEHLEERTEYFKNYRNNNKEKISERKKKYYKNNQSSNKVLTELEEWLKSIPKYFMDKRSFNNGVYIEQGMQKQIDLTLDKIQKLKEEYYV